MFLPLFTIAGTAGIYAVVFNGVALENIHIIWNENIRGVWEYKMRMRELVEGASIGTIPD